MDLNTAGNIAGLVASVLGILGFFGLQPTFKNLSKGLTRRIILPAILGVLVTFAVFFALNSGVGIRWGDLPARLASWLPKPEPAKAAEPSPAGPATIPPRPARLVLIVNNSGKMAEASRAASAFLPSLADEDSVSLITLLDEPRANVRHVWVLRDLPGNRAREQIGKRVATLFAVRRPRLSAAVEDAFRQLDQEPRLGLVPTVVVLPVTPDERDALNRWVGASGPEGHRPIPTEGAGAVWRATLEAGQPPRSAATGSASASR